MTYTTEKFPVVTVAQVPFRVATLEGASDWIIDAANNRRTHPNVRLANAYNVALANKDAEYGRLLVNEGVNFPDGAPVVWFMNLRRQNKAAGRIRGPSLFPLTLRKSVASGTRHFLLGSTPETLSRLEENIRASNPGIVIAGSYSPPFAAIDAEYVRDCAERVKASDADIVWLGLGTPKQDQLGTALARKIEAVTVNVGAGFDFQAGTVREAPEWVQQSGFEWLYRLALEPKRLWRRYLIGNVQFISAATRHHLRGSKRTGSQA